jgi:teichuronic acid biosynthesis glycosyltransferase TuaC
VDVTSAPHLVTFTNLYPSAARPTHGIFVAERVRRLRAALGASHEVICPIPGLPRFWPRRPADRVFDSLPEREASGGATLRHVRYRHWPGLSERAQAERMFRACREVVASAVHGQAAVIDAHYVYPDGVAALRLAAELGVPCFVTARGSDLNVLAQRPAIARQIRAWAGSAAGLFAVSEPLRRLFVEIAGVSDDAVELARNGVDFEIFRPGDEDEARDALGLPRGVPLVAGVGRLVPGKGFHTMARALRLLPEEVHFAVAGAGPEAERLRAVAPEGRLHLLGARSREEVAALLRGADVLVLPSEREGWPNVVTEALASGTPVVASPVGGIPDILTAPHVGALVRVGDHRALAREVERFLRAPSNPDAVCAFAQRFGWEAPIEFLRTRFAAAGLIC